MAPVAASMATTRFWPLTVAYTVEPSAENAAWADSACLAPSAGMLMVVGAATVPSALTGNRRYPLVRGTHSDDPSGEYVGPSWPTSLLLILRLAADEVPTSCWTVQFFRSTMVSAIPPSAVNAARWLPSGLTVAVMILPLLM